MTETIKLDKSKIAKLLILFVVGMFIFYPVRSQSNLLEDILSLSENVGDGAKSLIERGTDIFTGKSLLSPILDSLSEYISSIVVTMGSEFVNIMVDSFNPSMKSFANIVSGADYNAVTDNSSDAIFGIAYISTILGAAKLIGMSLATILLLFNLFLLMCGKAEAIKTSLPNLLVNYVISMVIIMNAESIIWEITSMFGEIWAKGVMASNPASNIAPLTFDSFWSIVTFCKSLCPLSQLYGAMLFIAIPIMWKMFKAFIRLYMAIIEHYLVMIVLLLFCPIIMPTMMTPTTSNMFKSYFRMIVSQFICMCVTVLMMKIFVSTLMSGGWTVSIINYIAGLAFLKVAQNIDMYMSKMGLDIVAGAGNFVNASRGAGMGLMVLARTVGMVRNGISSYGKNMMEQGIKNNDPLKFAQGAKVTSSVGGGPAPGTTFSSEYAKASNANSTHQVYTSNSQASAVRQALLSGNGMPKTMADQLDSRKYSNGTTALEQVHEIKQAGTEFEFRNGNGMVIATGDATVDDGALHWNHADSTSYFPLDEKEGAYFIGRDGMGAKESEIFSSSEVTTYMSNETAPVKGIEEITNRDVSGGIRYGEQHTRVSYGNDTYRDVMVGYRGSGLWSDAPNDWQVSNTVNSKGQEIRVAYSPLKNHKPDPTPVATDSGTKKPSAPKPIDKPQKSNRNTYHP